jgi:hypothetical protein
MNTSAVVLFVRLPDILNGIGDTEDDNPAQALEPSAAALVNDKYHSTKGTLLVFRCFKHPNTYRKSKSRPLCSC